MKGTGGVMKLVLGFAPISAFCLVLPAAAPEEKSPKPQYDSKGNLLRPADYRDWEFLSAGYGMNYSRAPNNHDLFTTVFVQRWAYEEFLKIGKWAGAVDVCNRRAGRPEQRLDQQDGTLSNRSDGPGSRS